MTIEEAKKEVEKYVDFYTKEGAPIQELGFRFQDILLSVSYELEAIQNRSCKNCKWYGYKHCKNENGIAFNSDNAVYEDDYCSDYEPKDKE